MKKITAVTYDGKCWRIWDSMLHWVVRGVSFFKVTFELR